MFLYAEQLNQVYSLKNWDRLLHCINIMKQSAYFKMITNQYFIDSEKSHVLNKI